LLETPSTARVRRNLKEEAKMRDSRFTGRWALLTVVLAMALAATPVLAQTQPATDQPATTTTTTTTTTTAPPAEPTQETRDSARQHFRAGRDAFTANNFEAALAEFRSANELIPASAALSFIGQCLMKLNRQAEALRTFRQYVTDYANPANDRERTALQEVKDWIDELEDVVGKVQVNVAVSGATVLVDGQVVGPAPLAAPVEVVQGPHTFRAEVEGYRPAEETLTVEAGQQVTVTLVPAPLQTTSSVNLSSNVPGAAAVLDGESLGALPFSGEVEAGVHQLEVSADGYDTARLAITLEAGQPFARTVELMASADTGEAWYEKWWVWTIAGVVVAGATAGIVLGATGGDTMPSSDWVVGLE
jgi:tetratricopeptide (TPR) repeat protein